MASYKSRKIKEKEYKINYNDIPRDLKERLNYMCDLYNISESKYKEILNKKQNLLNNLYYNDFKVILYEEPEGCPRPRTRIINRKNIANEAMNNSQFVHVYSISGKDDQIFMKRMIGQELIALDSLIYTPCIITIDCYFKTPTSFNITDKFLAEIGLIRHYMKPDWDNLGEKYSDMYNTNVWLDDSFVIDGRVRKFYSILPRVEIYIKYLNTLYNKKHYNTIINRKDINNTNISELTYLDKYGNTTLGGV